MEQYKVLNAELIEQIQKMKLDISIYNCEIIKLRSQLMEEREKRVLLEAYLNRAFNDILKNINSKNYMEYGSEDCSSIESCTKSRRSTQISAELRKSNAVTLHRNSLPKSPRSSYSARSSSASNVSRLQMQNESDEYVVNSATLVPAGIDTKINETLINVMVLKDDNNNRNSSTCGIENDNDNSDSDSDSDSENEGNDEEDDEDSIRTIESDDEPDTQTTDKLCTIPEVGLESKSLESDRENSQNESQEVKPPNCVVKLPKPIHLTDNNNVPLRDVTNMHNSQNNNNLNKIHSNSKVTINRGGGSCHTEEDFTFNIEQMRAAPINECIMAEPSLPVLVTHIEKSLTELTLFTINSSEQNIITTTNYLEFNNLPSSTPNNTKRTDDEPKENYRDSMETQISSTLSCSDRPRRKCRPACLAEPNMRSKMRNESTSNKTRKK